MNIWMLTAMRSGSTLLCNMLNSSGLIRRPDRHTDDPNLDRSHHDFEFLAPVPGLDPWRIGQEPHDREQCLRYLGKKASCIKHDNCLFKILMEHYRYYKLDGADRDLIDSIFQRNKYIWLERSDIYARTISAYQFFVSKMPHIYNEKMKAEYDRRTIPWDEDGVLDVYNNHIKNCDWSRFLRDQDYLKIEYENLVREPAKILSQCLEYAGLGIREVDAVRIANAQPKFKTERPETQEFIRRLKKLID